MASRAPACVGRGWAAHPANSPDTSSSMGPRRAGPVILAWPLLHFPVTATGSASQALMFTLILDFCGTQITSSQRSFHLQLSPLTRPLHAVSPRLAPRPSRSGVLLLRGRSLP